jgi:hypothetical protein
MKKMILIIIMFLFTHFFLSGDILRVNNHSEAMAPYLSIQSAYNEAVNGDTILFESGNGSDFEINKNLTIIGPGFFHDQYNHYTTSTSWLHSKLDTGFDHNGNNLLLSGLSFGNTGQNYFRIMGNDFIMKNCNCSTSGYNKLLIYGSDSKIFHCWFNEFDIYNYGSSDSLIIYNNCLQSFESSTTIDSTVIVFNNVITTLEKIDFTHLYNNIVDSIYESDLSNSIGYVIKYNIFGCSCPSGSGLDDPELHNIFNVDLNDVFTYEDGDRYYMLQTGCVAEGAGLNGEDCGMFGGSTPYPLGGMPPEIPAITGLDLNRSNLEPDSLNIIFEAKTFPRP